MSIGFKEWALVCEALGGGTQSIILRKGGIAEGRDGFRFKHDEFLLFPTLFHEQLSKTKLPPGSPIPDLELHSTAKNGADSEKFIHLPPPIKVLELAELMGQKPFQLIHDLMEMNIFASINQSIKTETAIKLCAKHGFTFETEKRAESDAVQKPVTVRIQYSARVEWTELVTDPALIAKLAPFHIWNDTEIEQRFRYDDIPGVNLAFIRIFRLEPSFSFPDEPKYGGCRSWVTLPEPPPETRLVPVLDDATHAQREAAVRAVLKP